MAFRRALATLSLAVARLPRRRAGARAGRHQQGRRRRSSRRRSSTTSTTLRGKFVGLAEAFPQDKYTWRPMEGVRSVSEVLMLAAMEGYSFIPTSFGAKPAPTSAPAKRRPSCAR